MAKLLNDERFRHVSYHSTDVRKTWARERKRLAYLKAEREAAQAAAVAEAEASALEAQVKVRKIAK